MKILQNELKEIKEIVKELKANTKSVRVLEKNIVNEFNLKIREYDENSFCDRLTIEVLKKEKDKLMSDTLELYGNDAMVTVIYKDGTKVTASGVDIVLGETVPKLQNIAYACYSDGYSLFDTLNGNLLGKWDIVSDEGFDEMEKYFSDTEAMFLQ